MRIPLRGSNLQVQEMKKNTASPTTSNDVLGALWQGLMNGMMRGHELGSREPRIEMLPPGGGQPAAGNSFALPVGDRNGSARPEGARVQLALPAPADTGPSAPVAPALVVNTGGQASPVDESLDSVRNQVASSAPQPEEPDVGNPGLGTAEDTETAVQQAQQLASALGSRDRHKMRRPAAAPWSSTKKKAPSSKATAKKKKPASQSKGKTGTKKKTKAPLQMTLKDVTSRAYHAAKAQAESKGWDTERAKAAGRRASKRAGNEWRSSGNH